MDDVKLTLGGIVGAVLLIIAFNLWGSNDYAEYKIRQAPGTGEMSIIANPECTGTALQMFPIIRFPAILTSRKLPQCQTAPR